MFVEAVWRRKRPHVLPNSAFLYIITHTPGHCFCIYNYYTFWEIVLFSTFLSLYFSETFHHWYDELEVSRTHESYRSLDLCWQSKLCSWKTSVVCSMCLCDWTLQQGVFSPSVLGGSCRHWSTTDRRAPLFTEAQFEEKLLEVRSPGLLVSASPLRTGWGGRTPAHFKLASSSYIQLIWLLTMATSGVFFVVNGFLFFLKRLWNAAMRKWIRM